MTEPQLTDEDRAVLEARLEQLQGQFAEYERYGQRNMASLTRDDICWVEMRLGIDHPSQPLIPTAEASLVRTREIKRTGLIENILSGFDELIRHEMDFAGPRKYQSTMKLCQQADKIRQYEMAETGGVAGYQDQLGDYIDNDGVGMMMGGPPRGGRLFPAARPPPLQDMTRLLTDHLDRTAKQNEDRDANPVLRLRDLLDIRERLQSAAQYLVDPVGANLAVIDAQIKDTILTLDRKDTPTDDQNTSGARPAPDPDLVLPEFSRGHSPGGDRGQLLRSGDDPADAEREGGDRQAVGDREQEGLVAEGQHGSAFLNYRFPPGADREGGEGAREAAQARADVDHGGAVR